MSLPLVSVDVIGIITFLLDGCDVFRLKVAGNRLLWTKIEACCTSLRCFVAPWLPFPFSAFSLPRLAHLSVSVSAGYTASPLSLHRQLPLPSVPLEGIESLDYNFLQSFRVLSLVDAYPVLSVAFPNLTRLKISGSHDFITPDNLRALPQTLKSFSAKLRKQFTASISYLDLLPNLPRCLERLSLKEIVVMANKQTRAYEGAEWPNSLRRVTINRFEAWAILRHLPVAIEEIKFTFMPAIKHRDPIRTSQLPRTLRKLVAKPIYVASPFILHDGYLPPNLVVYDVDLQAVVDNNATEGLSPFIQQFRFSEEVLQTMTDLDAKFPRLSSIGEDRAISAACVPYLPTMLKNLEIGGKASRTNPSTDPYPWEYLKHLNITRLEAPVGLVEQAQCLPSCLTSLSICPPPPVPIPAPGSSAIASSSAASTSDSRACQLEKSTFSALPSNLVSLSFSLELLPSLDCFALLPPNLTNLIFHAPKESKNLANDVSLFQHFPILPRLNSLHILDIDYAGAWRIWLRDLYDDDGRRTPQLKTLVVSMGNTDSTEMHDPSNSHLLFLPKTLTSLTIPATTGIEHEKQILSKLPGRLRTLELNIHSVKIAGVYKECMGIADEQMKDLPKSLTHLEIVASRVSLTPLFFKFLPPTISEILLPYYFARGKDVKNAIEAYYLNENWEGAHRLCNRSDPQYAY